MGTTVADNIGDDDNKIAFIFACPGRREEKHKKVCSGATGTNLDKLLVKLNEKYPKYFVSTNRYDYTIINSCDTVYPNPENPDKTEPDLFEIDEDDNLKRIYEEVKDKECIICFGNCADYAANSVMKKYPDLKFEKIKSDHLSPSNLNRNYESEKDVIVNDKYYNFDREKTINYDNYLTIIFY